MWRLPYGRSQKLTDLTMHGFDRAPRPLITGKERHTIAEVHTKYLSARPAPRAVGRRKELAGEAYQRYLEREANAAKIAELENGHRQTHTASETSKPQAVISN
jgi:hypothetical protein